MNGYHKTLRRDMHNRQIAGVCAGIAEFLGIDPTAVRIAYVLLSILSVTFPGIVVYIVLWLLIPEREYY
ncbi:MAG: PspC domain-containing protein [Phycisphaerae bacterium]